MTSASTEERGERGRAPELLRPLFLFTKLVLTLLLHHLHRHRRAPTQLATRHSGAGFSRERTTRLRLQWVLLSTAPAWSGLGEWPPFLLSVGAPGSEHFPPGFFFYLPSFCFAYKPSVGVSGSVPEREHDHLLLSVGEARPRVGSTVTFLLSVDVSGSVPDWERVGAGLSPGLGTGLSSFPPARASTCGLGPGLGTGLSSSPPALRYVLFSAAHHVLDQIEHSAEAANCF